MASVVPSCIKTTKTATDGQLAVTSPYCDVNSLMSQLVKHPCANQASALSTLLPFFQLGQDETYRRMSVHYKKNAAIGFSYSNLISLLYHRHGTVPCIISLWLRLVSQPAVRVLRLACETMLQPCMYMCMYFCNQCPSTHYSL